jgi:hypothetical protein
VGWRPEGECPGGRPAQNLAYEGMHAGGDVLLDVAQALPELRVIDVTRGGTRPATSPSLVAVGRVSASQPVTRSWSMAARSLPLSLDGPWLPDAKWLSTASMLWPSRSPACRAATSAP